MTTPTQRILEDFYNLTVNLEKENDRLKTLIHSIYDRWQSDMQAAFENGVKWINEAEAKYFSDHYPELLEFGRFLGEVYDKEFSDEE